MSELRDVGTLRSMSRRHRDTSSQKRRSWLLLLALAPILTFMGHWPTSLPIPGTDMFVSVPMAGQAADPEKGSEHSHGRHCHSDSKGCGDAPAAAGAGLALLSTPMLQFGATGMFLVVALLWWRPKSSAANGPELQPPRPYFSVA